MTLNRGQLRQAVIDNTQRTDKVTVINSLINRGLKEIFDRHDWRDLRREDDLPIAIDDLKVALPVDYHQLIEARVIDTTNNNSNSLRIMSKSVIVANLPDPSTINAGRPSIAYEEGRELFFIPKANLAYTIRVTISVDHIDLTADGDLPTVTDIDNAIISYVTAYLFDSIEDFQQGAIWRRLYERDILISRISDAKKLGMRQGHEGHHGHGHGVGDHHGGFPSVTPWLDPFVHSVHGGFHGFGH